MSNPDLWLHHELLLRWLSERKPGKFSGCFVEGPRTKDAPRSPGRRRALQQRYFLLPCPAPVPYLSDHLTSCDTAKDDRQHPLRVAQERLPQLLCTRNRQKTPTPVYLGGSPASEPFPGCLRLDGGLLSRHL